MAEAGISETADFKIDIDMDSEMVEEQKSDQDMKYLDEECEIRIGKTEEKVSETKDTICGQKRSFKNSMD